MKRTAKKRGGLGSANDALSALVPVQIAPRTQAPTDESQHEEERVEKDRFTLHLPVALMERAKNASYWTPGLTLAEIAENAIRAEVARLEQINGGPFKQRERKLVGGRRFA